MERQRWRPEEDALLRAYVKQYGPKEWNLISKRMGKTLDRDPKSCLERWKNYLKPGIKKGSLTPEEQNLVISLQAKYGNKWKKIAAEVPGRTAKRLGKWWEVFKEKQLKQLQKSQQRQEYVDSPAISSVSGGGSPEGAVSGKYDHILETFAEKYVHPKLFAFQPPLPPLPSINIMPNLEPPQVLSLSPVLVTEPGSSTTIPPWMNSAASASSSPSISLSLTPSEPALHVHEPIHQDLGRFYPVQQVGTLIQYFKELEEGRQNWVQHKKEATWRLNRLEQQLESEKARKRREKMEEIEAKMRCLHEEEMAFIGRVEREYRDQLSAVQRDAEAKEAKLMEAWSSKQLKLAKLIEKTGFHGHVGGVGNIVLPAVRKYIFSLACKLFLSIDDKEKVERLSKYIEDISTGLLSMPINLPGTTFNRDIRASKEMSEEVQEIINQRKSELLENKVVAPDDILSQMLQATNEEEQFWNESDIASYIVGLLQGGYSMVNAAITIIMKYMAEYPVVYSEVLKKQMEIANSKTANDLLNWEDFRKMRYSWNVASEVLRLVPPVHGTFREAIEDITYDGYMIPKGWKLHWK
ncbi:hypothetical protein K7X08_018440 [Anisodus acutangulus]|uniref:Uncharacterized protein n=1 Tax=Anisodus acutangulus TaxID=402998 RepID=A0A9Q1LZ71_9SOLA|nr:hypothetical protein K7X08_018440 [Anisodus acutangulus]